MRIRIDDPRRPQVRAMLRAHLADLARHSPPESRHALDADALCRPEVTLWSASLDGTLAGVAALQAIGPRHGEVKSMRTAPACLRRGVAAALLRAIVDEARRRDYRRLSLETGSMAAFAPAHALYRRFGFVDCAPFAHYVEDPNSRFMTLALPGADGATRTRGERARTESPGPPGETAPAASRDAGAQ